MSPARLETFADGVFAIAATLLILTVDMEFPKHSHDVGGDLLHHWPSFAAYGISFLTIGIIWANHHMLIGLIAKVDRTFVMLNVGLLMTIAFLPFPTRLVGEHIRGDGLGPAAIAYGITMTVMAVFFLCIWLYASRGFRLLKDDADERMVSGITRAYLPGSPIYLAATLLALVSPIASVAVFAAIALFYGVESAFFGRRGA
jgi:uncharacterized membrane protein